MCTKGVTETVERGKDRKRSTKRNYRTNINMSLTSYKLHKNLENVRNIKEITVKRSYNERSQNEEAKPFSMEHSSASKFVLSMGHMMDAQNTELRESIDTEITDAMPPLSPFKSPVDPVRSAHEDEALNHGGRIPSTSYVAENMVNGGDDVLPEKISHAVNATADRKFAETAYCYKYRNREFSKELESAEHKNNSFLQDIPINPVEREKISVNEISFELKLRADDPALCSGNTKRLKADGHENCTEHENKDGKSEFMRLSNVSKFVQVQHIQDISGIGKESSQISAPESLHMNPMQVHNDPALSAPGTFEVSGSIASQVYNRGETLAYVANNCQITSAADVSRVSTIVEGNNATGARVTKETSEGIQPRIRKRNIMNHAQMVVMENALKTEPYMRRHPELIMQWTDKLNKMVM